MAEKIFDLLKLAYRQRFAIYRVGDVLRSLTSGGFSLKRVSALFIAIIEMFSSVIFDGAMTPMGKELDSLADLITFGLAPALMCFKALCNIEWPVAMRFIPYAAFILAAAAALRLARFNIETHPDTTFSGLAVPANAIFWCGQMIWLPDMTQPFYGYILLAEVVLFSLLMTSRIPMFSLKFHNLTWKDNSIRYIFLLVTPLFIILFGIKGVACIILWYIILSALTCRK